jgi:hypothetical protein
VSVFFVVCVILLIAIGLGVLLSIPWSLGSVAGTPSAAILPESAEARGRLAMIVPPLSAIVGALPAVADGAGLRAAPAIEPPPADLSTIGCGEDKEETNAAIWREVQRTLAQRGRKTLPSGGR